MEGSISFKATFRFGELTHRRCTAICHDKNMKPLPAIERKTIINLRNANQGSHVIIRACQIFGKVEYFRDREETFYKDSKICFF